jgi:hypothetical protein
MANCDPQHMPNSTPSLPRLPDGSIGDYLISQFPIIISKVDREGEIATPWEANESTGGDLHIVCCCKIGRGGLGFVFEAAELFVYY